MSVCANECAEIPLRLLSIHVKPSLAGSQIPVRDWQTPTCQPRRRRSAEDGQQMHWQPTRVPMDTQLSLPQWLLSDGLSWNAQQEQKVPLSAQDFGKAALLLFPNGSSLPVENHTFWQEEVPLALPSSAGAPESFKAPFPANPGTSVLREKGQQSCTTANLHLVQPTPLETPVGVSVALCCAK